MSSIREQARRDSAARFLAKAGPENDPYLFLFALLIHKIDHVESEITMANSKLEGLSPTDTRKKRLISKIIAWILVPLLTVTAAMAGLYVLNSSNTKIWRSITGDPEHYNDLAKTALQSLNEANRVGDTLGAIHYMLQLPGARLGIVDDRISIVVPTNAIRIQVKSGNETQITFAPKTDEEFSDLIRRLDRSKSAD